MALPDFQVEIVSSGALPDYRVAVVAENATPRPDYYMIANVGPRLPDYRVAIVASNAVPAPDFRVWGLSAGPANTVAPVISGTAQVGQTLTSTTGTWSGSPTGYTYQWKRGATNVGTNANTYVPVTGDIGANITCVVTATNAGGSTSATSNSLGPVIAASGAPPVNTVAPVISGTATEGQVLTSTQGTWSPAGTTYAYQWKRGATNVGTNASTYTLVTADVGANMTCVVTATNTDGSASATSNSLGPVAALPVFSAWNPLDKGPAQALSFGNRTVTQSTTPGSEYIVRGTQSRATGKYKVEITVDLKDGSRPGVGMGTASFSIANGGFTGDTTTPNIGVFGGGQVLVDGSLFTNIGALTAGETVSFEYDSAALTCYVQRSLGGSRTAVPVQAATYFPAAQTGNASTVSQATINTGQAAFVIAPTSGFTAWG